MIEIYGVPFLLQSHKITKLMWLKLLLLLYGYVKQNIID